MRIVLTSLAAAAASALAVSSPASAQWAPPPPYGYGTQHYGVPGYEVPGYGAPGYGYGYGHGDFARLHALQQQIEQIRQRIHRLDRMNRLSNREARRLNGHAVALQRRIANASYRGVNPWERQDLQRRVEGLREAVRYAARDGNRRWGWNGYDRFDNSYGYYGSRDGGWERGRDDRRDGDRWDREHDRWHDRHDD